MTKLDYAQLAGLLAMSVGAALVALALAGALVAAGVGLALAGLLFCYWAATPSTDEVSP